MLSFLGIHFLRFLLQHAAYSNASGLKPIRSGCEPSQVRILSYCATAREHGSKQSPGRIVTSEAKSFNDAQPIRQSSEDISTAPYVWLCPTAHIQPSQQHEYELHSPVWHFEPSYVHFQHLSSCPQEVGRSTKLKLAEFTNLRKLLPRSRFSYKSNLWWCCL